MAFANDIRSIDTGFADRVASFFKTLQEARQRRKVFNQTMAELHALSARDLDDLGISRSMITRVAAEAAYGRNK